MQDKQTDKDTDSPEIKAGYLVMRLKPGEGVMIFDSIEVRLSCIKTMGEAQVAIRAPKDFIIRKLR
jgi:sRNA-binding carbon storage regulator CsrA